MELAVEQVLSRGLACVTWQLFFGTQNRVNPVNSIQVKVWQAPIMPPPPRNFEVFALTCRRVVLASFSLDLYTVPPYPGTWYKK